MADAQGTSLTNSGKYERILKLLAGLFNRKDIYVALSPPFRVDFEIDPAVLSASLKEANFEEKDFREDLSEIEAMVSAILRHDEEGFTKAQLEEIKYKKDEEAKTREIEKLRENFKVIKSFLQVIDPRGRLERRYKWKGASKAPTYTTADWDVKEKIADSKMGSLRFPYATCRIKFQREFGSDPLFILGGRMFDAVQINFSKVEAQHFAKVLQRIVQELERAEEAVSKSESKF